MEKIDQLIPECKKQAARLLRNKKISSEELETFVKYSNDPIAAYNHHINETEKILSSIKAKKDLLVDLQKKVIAKHNTLSKS